MADNRMLLRCKGCGKKLEVPFVLWKKYDDALRKG